MTIASLMEKIGTLSIGLAFLFAAPAQAAPGDLDLTFAGTGKVRIGLGGGPDVANAVAVQSDGKIVVAGASARIASSGASTDDFSVARYHGDGSFDTSFGTGGKVLIEVGTGAAIANAVRIQTDGKIVVAGSADNGAATHFAVLRLNADGTLDPSFGGNGTLITAIGTASSAAAAIIQPDGKIILAGNSGANFALARYHPNGALDGAFGGGDGIATSTVAGTASAITLQPDVTVEPEGKILVVGTRRYPGGTCPEPIGGSIPGQADVLLARFLQDGTPDNSFDGDGVVVTSVGYSDDATAIAIQAGHSSAFVLPKIVVAGSTAPLLGNCSPTPPHRPYLGPSSTIVLRYNLDGMLDSSFGGDGIVISSFSSGSDGANAVLVQGVATQPRKITIGGFAEVGADPLTPDFDFLVARYDVNGNPESAFDGDGFAITPMSADSDRINAIATPGSALIGVGVSGGDFFGPAGDVAIARYNLGTGALDTTFDGDGMRIDDIGDTTANAKSVAIQPDGKIIVAGSRGSSGVRPALVRLNTDGSPDPAFDGDGRVLANITGIANAVLIQPDAKILLAGSSGSDFALLRYNANGSPDTSFSDDGATTTNLNGSDAGVAVGLQSGGLIIVGGTSNNDFALTRYNGTDGMLDTSFGLGGKAITPIGNEIDVAQAMLVQPDDRIVLAGYADTDTSATTNHDFAVVRYNPDGSPDNSFDFDSKALTPIGSGNDQAFAIARQADGKLVVAGFTTTASGLDLAVVRYTTNGAPDNSFDGDGKVTTPIDAANGPDQGMAVAIQPDGKILVAGFSGPDAQQLVYAVVRYNATGSLDTSFGGGDGGVVVDVSEDGSDSGHGVALDASGNIVVVGESGGLFGVMRLVGGGSAPAVVSAVSRKVHGTPSFDINLPLTGNPGVECRTGGASGGHMLIFTFANTLTSVGSASVTSGTGSVSSRAIDTDAHNYIVNLTGVTNGQEITVRLTNVNDSAGNNGSASISMGVLIGDTTGNRSVNASDVSQTKSKSGQTVGTTNFRSDVTVSNSINSSDVSMVKSKSGTALP